MGKGLALSRLRLPRGTLGWLAGCGVALAAVAIAWQWGPGERGAFDSAFYVDGARHLARGDGYVCAYVKSDRSDYEPITHWAPGVSILIATGLTLGLPLLTAAAVAIGGGYVAAVLLIYLLGIGLTGRSHWLPAAVAALFFALTPSTLLWLDFILSDLVWAAAGLLCLVLALRITRVSEPSFGLRVAFGLSLVWLVLVRYAGVLFIPGLVVVTVLAMASGRPLWKRALLLWPSLLLAAIGMVGWSMRNQWVSNAPLGGFVFNRSDVWNHLDDASYSAFIWVDEALMQANAIGIEAPLRIGLWSALASVLALVVASLRSGWRELLLVAGTAGAYFAAMVFTATVTVIENLRESRFWIVFWALTYLFVLVASGRATHRFSIVPKVVVGAVALVVLGLFANKAYLKLPTARAQLGLLSPAWASAAERLPGPDECHVFVNDPRPFMLHRELGPTRELPQNLAEFEARAAALGGVCVVTTDKTKRLMLSKSAEKHRIGQNAVLDALHAQKRLALVRRGAGVRVYRLK